MARLPKREDLVENAKLLCVADQDEKICWAGTIHYVRGTYTKDGKELMVRMDENDEIFSYEAIIGEKSVNSNEISRILFVLYDSLTDEDIFHNKLSGSWDHIAEQFTEAFKNG